MILLPFLMAWAFYGMHQSMDCAPGVLGMLHEHCASEESARVVAAGIGARADTSGRRAASDAQP